MINKYIAVFVFLPAALTLVRQSLHAFRTKQVYMGWKYAFVATGFGLWGISSFCQHGLAVSINFVGALALVIGGMLKLMEASEKMRSN